MSTIHLCLFMELHVVLIMARVWAQRWHMQITTCVCTKIQFKGSLGVVNPNVGLDVVAWSMYSRQPNLLNSVKAVVLCCRVCFMIVFTRPKGS